MQRLAVPWPLVAFAGVTLVGCTERLLLPGPGGGGGIEGTGTGGGSVVAVQDAAIANDGSPDSGGRGDRPERGQTGGDGGGDAAVTCTPKYGWIDIRSPESANVMLVVARNPSMASPFLDTSRIQAVQKVIRDAIDAYPDALNFGYLDYPGMDASCLGGCCVDSPVPPTPVTSQQIGRALQPCDNSLSAPGCISPSDNRPIAAALNSILTDVFGPRSSWSGNADRSVILFADSAPGCTSEAFPQACAEAKSKVNALAQASVKTYVIPIAQDGGGSGCLQELALVGSNSTAISPVQSPADLNTRFINILSALAQSYCSLDLSQEPKDKSTVRVLLNGGKLPRDDSGSGDGWNFVPGSSVKIDVHGTSCQTLQKTPFQKISVQEVRGCAP